MKSVNGVNTSARSAKCHVWTAPRWRRVGLTAFSVGGVIAKEDKILDVVPEQESLVIETQIPLDDISEVHPNMRADVHLTAYKARIIRWFAVRQRRSRPIA